MSIFRCIVRWLHGEPARTQIDRDYSEALVADFEVASKKLEKRVAVLKGLTARLRMEQEGGDNAPMARVS